MHVWIANPTANRVAYSRTKAAFVTTTGGGLSVEAVRYDGGESGLREVTRGETEEWSFETNGYTTELVVGQGGKPIQFQLRLYLDKVLAAGPFFANLPNLERMELTSPHFLDDDDWTDCQKLVFFR